MKTFALDLTVTLPIFNEAECIDGVLQELFGVLDGLSGTRYEVIAVDDGSTDATPERLREAAARHPALRILRLEPNAGQSAAMGAAFRAARGEIVITLDADGQNDPNDIPALIDGLRECDVCCGYRHNRRDTATKRIGSRIANRIRRRVLKDDIIDTGCTLKAFRHWVVADLTMWKGMHRFLPLLARMQDARIHQIPVNHRPRAGGVTKYTHWSRLRQTLWDLWAVRWMQKRNPRFRVSELTPGGVPADAPTLPASRSDA